MPDLYFYRDPEEAEAPAEEEVAEEAVQQEAVVTTAGEEWDVNATQGAADWAATDDWAADAAPTATVA
jgi:hypothetical protein